MGRDVLHPLAIDIYFAAVAQTLQIFGAGEWPALGADGVLAFDPFHEGLSSTLPSRPRVKTHYPRELRCGQNRGPGRRKARSVSAIRSSLSTNPAAIFTATRRDAVLLAAGVVARRS